MRDFIIVIAEWLFWALDGVPIANTPWIVVWILGWLLFIAHPYWSVIQRLVNRNSNPFFMLFALAVAVFASILALAPGVAQMDMMKNCRTAPGQITVGIVYDQPAMITECQTRDNRYNEFGDWKLTTVIPK